MSYLKLRDTLPTFFWESNMLIHYFVGNWPISYGNEEQRKIQKLWRSRAAPDIHPQLLAVYYDLAHEVFASIKSVLHPTILYEDLNSNSMEETKKLLKIMDLDAELAEEACKALARDSQNGIFGQRGNESVIFTDEMRINIDAAFQECGSKYRFDTPLSEIREHIQLD